MKKKQAMALLFAAGASAAIYSDVQAAEVIQSSDSVVDSKVQGDVQLANPIVTNNVYADKIVNTIIPNAAKQILTAFPSMEEKLKEQYPNGFDMTVKIDRLYEGADGRTYVQWTNPPTIQLQISNTNNNFDETDISGAVETTVAHELIHTFMFLTMPRQGMGTGGRDKYPNWFIEGTAQLGGGGFTSGNVKNFRAFYFKLKGNVDDSKEDGNIASYLQNYSPEDQGRQYEQGYMAVAYLAYKANEKATQSKEITSASLAKGMDIIYRELAKGTKFNDALKLTTGLDAKGIVEAFDKATANDDLVTFTRKFICLSDAGGSVITDNISNYYNGIVKDDSIAHGTYGLNITQVTVSGTVVYDKNPKPQPEDNSGNGTQPPVTPPGDNNGGGTQPPVTPPEDNNGGGTQPPTTKPGDNNGGATPPPEKPENKDVVVVNNVKLKDTVTVSNVTKGDLVKVYSDANKSKVIGKATAKKDNVVIKISKGLPTEGNVIYITKKAKGKGTVESEPIPVTFDPEKVTDSPNESDIQVANNLGKKKDTITVTNVKAKDVVKVYATPEDAENVKAKPIGTAKVRKDGAVTVKIKKGFDFTSDTGVVYVSVQSYNERNSKPVEVKVGKDAVASTIDASNIVFTNNVDRADMLTVKGLKPKQIIKVYKDTSTTAFKKATANKSGEAVIKFKANEQFDVSDVLNITISSKLEGESARMRVEIKEAQK